VGHQRGVATRRDAGRSPYLLADLTAPSQLLTDFGLELTGTPPWGGRTGVPRRGHSPAGRFRIGMTRRHLPDPGARPGRCGTRHPAEYQELFDGQQLKDHRADRSAAGSAGRGRAAPFLPPAECRYRTASGPAGGPRPPRLRDPGRAARWPGWWRAPRRRGWLRREATRRCERLLRGPTTSQDPGLRPSGGTGRSSGR